MLHIIWDLDGTLIDSSHEIHQSLELSVKASGLDKAKQLKPFVIGPTIDTILREAYSSDVLTDAVLNETIAAFREIYDNSDFEQTKPYPGIEKIIFDTTKFVHHIVTNKPDNPTKKIIQKLKWTESITSIRTPYTNRSNSHDKLSSKHELYADLISEFDIASVFIGIGDMRDDCFAAKTNQITAVGVLWGSGAQEELSGCSDYIFDNTEQLYDFCCNFIEQKRLAG